jgi:hypothetical protein
MTAMIVPEGPVQPVQPVRSVSLGDPSVLNEVRSWFERFVTVIDDTDLDLLTVWAAHTYLVIETYTTPRLIIDSPVPGSGKTTVLEHLERLCNHPVQVASLSSPALLVRILDAGLRTILIDEADRSLRPDKPDVADLLAVLNSGYKRGATRPVLVPVKGGSWAAKEMPTYSPVAMAGNDPNLPDDTKSRSIRVLLMPDIDGSAEESDWELYEEESRALGELLAAWADVIRDDVRANRPTMPEGVRGRARERWSPLKRVAVAAGGDWPELVDRLAVQDVERLTNEREEGIVQQRPHITLLTHIYEVWRGDEGFVATTELIDRLVVEHPESWGELSAFGKRLTAQRLGRMLTKFGVHTCRPDSEGPRGYTRASFSTAMRRMGVTLPNKPAEPAEPAELAPSWTSKQCACGNNLLLAKPGRTQCERCRVEQERAS